MKISRLISNLEVLKDMYGDLPISVTLEKGNVVYVTDRFTIDLLEVTLDDGSMLNTLSFVEVFESVEVKPTHAKPQLRVVPKMPNLTVVKKGDNENKD